jgi:hypothetical protein
VILKINMHPSIQVFHHLKSGEYRILQNAPSDGPGGSRAWGTLPSFECTDFEQQLGKILRRERDEWPSRRTEVDGMSDADRAYAAIERKLKISYRCTHISFEKNMVTFTPMARFGGGYMGDTTRAITMDLTEPNESLVAALRKCFV